MIWLNPLLLIIVVALALAFVIFGIIGHKFTRDKDSFSRKYRLLVASVFAIPLLIILLLVVNLLLIEVIGGKVGTLNRISYFLGWPVLYAYYIAPSPIGIVYSALSATFVGFAWFAKSKSRFYKVVLSIYTVVALCFIGYAMWWHLTGQRFQYL